jgi:hypothetical protein
MTSSSNETLERIARRVRIPESAYERLLRRRDRRRRNQRIAAGVVGIVVFVAAVGLVTTFGSSDRRQPGASGGAATGPTATGPTVTGPTVTPTETSDDGWDGNGIPPVGVALSIPAEGEVVAEYAELHAGYVFVYADGRVIWHRDGVRGINEQRLTPEGIEIVQSGPFGKHPIWKGQELLMVQILYQADGTVLPAEVFDDAGAWADPRIRPYAPARFAICFGRDGVGGGNYLDPSRYVDLLPAPAQALLRGKEHTYEGAGPLLVGGDPPTECFELTTEEARALDQILSDAGLERDTAPDSGDVSFGLQDEAGRVGMDFNPLFPHGLWHFMGG